MQKAFAYYRTSSAYIDDENQESLTRQKIAVERYAKQAGYTIVDWYTTPRCPVPILLINVRRDLQKR